MVLSFLKRKDDPYMPTIYASGSGSQYANNTLAPSSNFLNYATSKPSTYVQQKPTTTTTPYKSYATTQSLMRQSPAYSTSTVKPTTATTNPPYTAPTVQAPQNNALSKLQQIGTNRQQFYQTQADQEAERQKKIFDIRNQTLQAQIPDLEGRLNKYRTLSDEAIKNQELQTQLAREQIKQDSGEEMRLNAQTAREGRGRIQSTLAGLNALDSSSTGQLLAKAEGNLVNKQATALRAQKQQLAQADQGLLQYKQQAQLAVDDEIAKFNQAIRDISANLDINSVEYQTAVKQAYDKAQESIYGIENDVANAELEVQKIYDKASAEQSMAGAGSNNQGKALQMVNNLLSGNTQAVSGGFRTPGFLAPYVPGAAAARADYDGLKNLLALAGRGQLKGSGAVSDFEAKMLEKAAMAGLSPELPEQEFVARLKQLQADLMSGGAVDNRSQTTSSSDIVTKLQQAGFSDAEIQEYLRG